MESVGETQGGTLRTQESHGFRYHRVWFLLHFLCLKTALCPSFSEFQHICDHIFYAYCMRVERGKYRQRPLPLNLSFIITMQLHLLILMFLLQTRVICVKPCGKENVTAAEGGEVILRVPQSKSENTEISWVLLRSGTVVARTEPGNPINENSVMNEYRGRMSSEADGSLHIYHLLLKDQGVYKADIRTRGADVCVEFNLTVYENLSSGDININHSLTRNDTCSLGLLCTVEKSDVTITWSNGQSGHINVTRGVLYVPPSDVNLTYTCTARNPVSNVSKTVIPGEYCRKDFSLTRQNQKDLCTITMIRWVLSGVVLTITCCIVMHHVKSEVIQPPGRC